MEQLTNYLKNHVTFLRNLRLSKSETSGTNDSLLFKYPAVNGWSSISHFATEDGKRLHVIPAFRHGSFNGHHQYIYFHNNSISYDFLYANSFERLICLPISFRMKRADQQSVIIRNDWDH